MNNINPRVLMVYYCIQDAPLTDPTAYCTPAVLPVSWLFGTSASSATYKSELQTQKRTCIESIILGIEAKHSDCTAAQWDAPPRVDLDGILLAPESQIGRVRNVLIIRQRGLADDVSPALQMMPARRPSSRDLRALEAEPDGGCGVEGEEEGQGEGERDESPCAFHGGPSLSVSAAALWPAPEILEVLVFLL